MSRYKDADAMIRELKRQYMFLFGTDEIPNGIGMFIENFPTANVRETDAPKTYSEQLNLDCEFCRCHEQGDTLYDWSDWDGGVGFDYIRDIKFCPICGRELFVEKEDQDDGMVSV